ncbi:Cytochrome c oxidase subunit 5B, mitochondrial [Naganishia albida]|nr:Cytochrome c oxidase subunit 5B, mitochondrial [Naganishia albida]
MMSSRVLRTAGRRFASTTAAPAPSSQPIKVLHSTSNASGAVLGNIEATWTKLPKEEQYEVYRTLEEVQKRDWKQLTVDEKKASYFVAYGPHGPRAPINTPGNTMRVAIGTAAAIGTAFAIFSLIRSQAPPPPKTMTKEWQEAMNEKAKEDNLNPITGISSEGYQGKGYVLN